jgi:ketosteroid isomerase-like protein
VAVLTDQDHARLRQIFEVEWMDAGLARDWASSLALCSEDFVYMPPDHPVLMGKEEALAFLEGFPDVTSADQSIVEISGDSSLVVIRGSFNVAFEANDQQLTGSGKLLCTASRSSGDWKLTACCFNWDAPPA